MRTNVRDQSLLEVEANGRHNILVWRQALRDHIGIEDDIAAEEQTATTGIDHVHGAAERNEDSDKASHHCDGKLGG